MNKAILIAILLAGCERAGVASMPDAAPASATDDAATAPADVPAEASCDTYQQMIDAQQIVPARSGYRILVARVPFDPLWSEGDVVLNGNSVLVWGPEIAGDRIGAVGRIDQTDPTRCAWADAE